MRALLAKKQSCPGLTQSLRYAYTPMSCYKIENKINPILSVTFGDNTKELIELHIRVSTILDSAVRERCPENH